MKYYILQNILKKLSKVHYLKTKIAMAALVFIAASGFVLWVSVAAAIQHVSALVVNPEAKSRIAVIKEELKSLPVLSQADCWYKAKSLFTLEAWAVREPVENIKRLKYVCLEKRPPVCEGSECRAIDQLNFATIGDFI